MKKLIICVLAGTILIGAATLLHRLGIRKKAKERERRGQFHKAYREG